MSLASDFIESTSTFFLLIYEEISENFLVKVYILILNTELECLIFCSYFFKSRFYWFACLIKLLYESDSSSLLYEPKL